MNEWTPVPGAGGYFADRAGNVKGPRCILKPTPLANGYLGVKIAGKGTTVHAAVAAAFHGPRPSKRHSVNHKNGKKTDNRPENLEWVTHSENIRHAIDVLGVKFGPSKKAQSSAAQRPTPGSAWRRVLVEDGAGRVLLDAVLHVPMCAARCDQSAAVIDGAQSNHLVTATEIATKVRGAIGKRPSIALLVDMQRKDLMA